MFRYLLPLLLLFMIGCSHKVNTDFDPSYKTESLKTFSIVHKSRGGIDTLDDERITAAITHELERKGYRPVAKEAADFHVTFQTRLEEDVPSNVSFGFGFGTYSSGVGTSVGTTHNVSSDQEHIDINMIDPLTKKTFWRASESRKYRHFKTPQARSDYFDKIIASMLNTFAAQPVTGQ